MKTTVLFVDDESLILQGLQRTFRCMRQFWEMKFVGSGQEALAVMAGQRVDVIISDMRMPGMNGAQLLNEVMRLYPQTIRLILSGHSDYDLIMRSVGATHQFLTKPCDPDLLKATIDRALTLGATLRNEGIRSLVSQLDCLPCLPELFHQLSEKLESGEATVTEIASIVARDPGMSSKILKLVNSSFFGLRRQLVNIAEAVSFLGMDTIRSLVLSLNVFGQYDARKTTPLSVEQLWVHSMLTAATTRIIARTENQPSKVVDEAFISALLHDTGRMVLAANLPAEYERVQRICREEHTSLCVAEQHVFGTTHQDVGGYLMGLWGLPIPVVEAIALHHSPQNCILKEFSPLVAVYSADRLVSEHDQDVNQAPPEAIDMEYMESLGVGDHVKLWRDALEENLVTN